MNTGSIRSAIRPLMLAAFVSVAIALPAVADGRADLPLDIKPLALETYGLRGAVAVNSNVVVAVLGASTTGERLKAVSWRVRSEEDPDYAYPLFIKPKAVAKVIDEVEFPLPENFKAPDPAKNKMQRYLVALTLPRPLRQGVRYGLVLHGDGGLATGGKSGCQFTWDGSVLDDPEKVRVPADDIAARLVGLRRVSPLGDGKIALEFGATFSTSGGCDLRNYEVTVNGERMTFDAFGRRSKIDVYLPIGWPFKTILQHDIFLDLGRDLKPGDRVEVKVGPAVCSGEREASFVFDPSTTISGSIQANQIGYLPDTPKVAYLGFWLGSFPEKPKSVDKFDYSTPPTPEAAYFVTPPAEEAAAAEDPAAATDPNSSRYEDLAPYALRFREAPAFELVCEKDGKVAYSGIARFVHNGLLNDGRVNHSAENVYVLDFTDFATPGRYYLRVPGVGRSIAFDISTDVYARPFKVQSTGVFAQRCGFELTPDRAPHWHRIACHTNGVQLTTVAKWKHPSFGPFRENPVPSPNPDYPRLAAIHEALLADKALVARFPLEGDMSNTVAGASVALSRTGEGCTFVDDATIGAKVLRTGRKGNGFTGEFPIDPAVGATATFWMLREDVDGNNYSGDLIRFGGSKGSSLVFTASWGILKLGGATWRRVGDRKWRHYAIRISPVGDDGKMEAVLTVDGEKAAQQRIKPPETDEFTFAGATGDGAAGSHFSDLRLYGRVLSGTDLTNLATRASKTIPAVIPLVGGHHDAGDYNPRCHIEVAQTLLAAYEHAPRKFFDGQLDIPEASNGLPDIVDEALWALKPWTYLQDVDGGVRAGTESAGDPNFHQTVELDDKGDFAYDKDSKASFIFAGAFAQASRVLASCGRAKEAADFLSRARRAYAWAVENVPEGLSSQGQFTEYRLSSRAYAAAELLHTTGEEAFLRDFRECSPWGSYKDADIRVHGKYEAAEAAYAFVRDPAAKNRDPVLYESVRAAILREADWYIKGSDAMAYKFVRHPDAPINWGTGAYGNHIPPVLAAWFLTGDGKYRDWIVRTCDVMLGANPLGLSWITGLGERGIRAPLHNSRYRPEGLVVDGLQGEGPVGSGRAYNYKETVHPAHDSKFAVMHSFVDCHFAIGMDEGLVVHQALDMAIFGLLLPDAR